MAASLGALDSHSDPRRSFQATGHCPASSEGEADSETWSCPACVPWQPHCLPGKLPALESRCVYPVLCMC